MQQVLAAVKESHTALSAQVGRGHAELLERLAAVEQQLRWQPGLGPAKRPSPRSGAGPPPLPMAGKMRSGSRGTPRGVDTVDPREDACESKAHSVSSSSQVARILRDAAGLGPKSTGQNLEQVATPRTAATKQLRESVRRVASHPAFEAASAIVSIGNAIAIGVQTDQALKEKIAGESVHAGWPPSTQADGPAFLIINIFFALWVFAELLLRYFVHTDRVFTSPMLKYVLLDIFVIVASVAEVAMYQFGLSFLRVLRLILLVRTGRSIVGAQRVRGVRRIVSAAARSIRSFVWIVALLFLFVWVAALLLLQVVTLHYPSMDQTRTSPLSASSTTDAEVFDLLFGSVSKATFTLFAVITGGLNWYEATEPLINLNPFYGFFFLVYVSLMALGALNVISAFFVDQAMVAAQRDRRRARGEQLEVLQSVLREAQGSREVLAAETIEAALERPEVQEALRGSGVGGPKAKGLLTLLGADQRGVSAEEFAANFVCMQSEAADPLGLLCEGHRFGLRIEALDKQQRQMADRTGASLKRLELMVSSLSRPGQRGRSSHSPHSPPISPAVKSPKCQEGMTASTCMPGGAQLSRPVKAGHVVLQVSGIDGFTKGQRITIVGDGYSESRILKAVKPFTLDSPLKLSYPVGAEVLLQGSLGHDPGGPVEDSLPVKIYHFDDDPQPHGRYSGSVYEALKPVVPKLELNQVNFGTRLWLPHVGLATVSSTSSTPCSVTPVSATRRALFQDAGRSGQADSHVIPAVAPVAPSFATFQHSKQRSESVPPLFGDREATLAVPAQRPPVQPSPGLPTHGRRGSNKIGPSGRMWRKFSRDPQNPAGRGVNKMPGLPER